MTLRRTTCALAACAVVLLVLSHGLPGGIAIARADGINRRSPRAPRRRPPAAPRETIAVPTVGLLDDAGFHQLLARGTPPQDKPLLVNFWATWCEPCRLEFPDLVKIDRDYRARGLDFVAISTDDPAEATKGVPKFLRAHRAHMPAYVLNVTDSEPVINSVDPTWGGELPATFLFDRHGRIVFQHKGRINPKELRAAIEKVIGEQ
jgi:thiol-disulfide isomerase/thioredoxin